MSMMKRVPAWLPYLNSIENKGDSWIFKYKGGELKTTLDSLQCLLIYGDSEITISPFQLEQIVRRGIPIIIHRRNVAQPIYITGGIRPDQDDVLTYQLNARQNEIKTRHIARQLLKAKFSNMQWLDIPQPQLPQDKDLDELRNIEAVHAAKYWRRYFQLLDKKHGRRGKEPYSMALDAVSKFISGILLRWVQYHHLSPYHGFLHQPTTYPSLIYDLMEPYRGMIERRLLQEWLKTGSIQDKNRLMATTIAATKDLLDEKVYIPLTRQIVTRHELLHGIVLSLRFYLLGRQKTFMIPIEGKPNGGRPRKVSFRLYGRQAGKTDFWIQAREAARTID